MTLDKDSSRRDFFRSAALVVTGVLCFGHVRKALGKTATLPAGATAVSPNDSLAQTLGYKPTGKEVDKAKYPTYKPDQTCRNCAFYASANSGWGNCQILKSGVVSATGWCSSWNKKA